MSEASLYRARLSLEGLPVGDAFGARFFGPAPAILARLESGELPPPPWRYTDDMKIFRGGLSLAPFCPPELVGRKPVETDPPS